MLWCVVYYGRRFGEVCKNLALAYSLEVPGGFTSFRTAFSVSNRATSDHEETLPFGILTETFVRRN
jgi:hypothetical protein